MRYLGGGISTLEGLKERAPGNQVIWGVSVVIPCVVFPFFVMPFGQTLSTGQDFTYFLKEHPWCDIDLQHCRVMSVISASFHSSRDKSTGQIMESLDPKIFEDLLQRKSRIMQEVERCLLNECVHSVCSVCVLLSFSEYWVYKKSPGIQDPVRKHQKESTLTVSSGLWMALEYYLFDD